MTMYRRVLIDKATVEQTAVWERSENALVYHMTSTDRAMTVAEIAHDFNRYVAGYPDDFPPGSAWTEEQVTAALGELADAGWEERVA